MSVEQTFERFWQQITSSDEVSSRSPSQKAIAKRCFLAGAQIMRSEAIKIIDMNPKAKAFEIKALVNEYPMEGRQEENWEPDNR